MVKGYKIWSLFENRVILSRNIVFDENSMFYSTMKSTFVSESGGVEKQLEQVFTQYESEPQQKVQKAHSE